MLISTQNAEHYNWGNGCDGWHFLKTDGLSVIKESVPAGESEKRHAHKISRQFFYILEGEALIEIDGKSHTISAGHGIEVAPGISHKFRNISKVSVEFLVISSPKSHGDRVDKE